jgi:hypothetical protein
MVVVRQCLGLEEEDGGGVLQGSKVEVNNGDTIVSRA